MYDATKTKITTEMVPRNCEPKPTSVFVNGTANVPHTPATKCAGIAPTTSVSYTHLTLPTNREV